MGKVSGEPVDNADKYICLTFNNKTSLVHLMDSFKYVLGFKRLCSIKHHQHLILWGHHFYYSNKLKY